MIKRLVIAASVSLALGLGTILLWGSLKENNEEKVARIAEAESYAARSQLVRSVDTFLAAMQNVRAFWSTYGRLPQEQWASDAGIELEHFGGVTMLLWEDPSNGVRYARTPENPTLNYRPTDEEWAMYEWLLAKARTATQNAISGPFLREDGSAFFEVYFVNAANSESGVLAAVIDAPKTLARMLQDESPGYAIRVYAGEIELFARGEPAANAPDNWTRAGLIQSSLGTVWRVVHMPTTDLVGSFEEPSVGLVLLLGLVTAVLMGTLTFENGRARSRADAAEKAETKLAALNRSLEQQVADRTRQLAVRSMDLQTLTESVAHDLRNPLNTVSVNVQLLEEHSGARLGEAGLKILHRLMPSVKQMAHILDRLLGLSAVSHSTFQRESVDMQELVREILEDLIVAEPPPPVRIEIGELPTAFADRKLVHMLVMNLLSNGVKYTRQSEDRFIRVSFEETDTGPAYCVSDNGIGFDPEDAVRLFAAFTRLDGAGQSDGVGLGLTIATRAVERHEGRIWAVSEKGQGAKFYFTLGTDDGMQAA